MEEAYIPDENVVGGVGNGWAVAITTLMNERAGLAFAAQAALQIALRKVIELAGSNVAQRQSRRRGPGDPRPARTAVIESEIFRVTNYRGLTKIMKTGVPGPEGSLGKWQWADVNQAPDGAGDGDRGPLLRSSPTTRSTRSPTATGSTSSCARGPTRSRAAPPRSCKNIVAERVLGLPKLQGSRMNFDLTDEQQMLQARGAGVPRGAAQLRADPRGVAHPTTHSTRTCGSEMSDLNWPGLMVSEDHGGQELGTVELAVLMEQLGYALAPGPDLLDHAGRARARDGRHRRAARALPGAAGDRASSAARWRSGTAAPDGRRTTSRSSPSRSNGGYTLNGEKLFVLDAARADFLIVGATGDRRFIVERDAAGVIDHADADDRRHAQAVRGQARRREGRRGRGVRRRRRARRSPARAPTPRSPPSWPAWRSARSRWRSSTPRSASSSAGRSAPTRPCRTSCAQMLLETEGARSAAYYAAWAADNEPETAPLAASMAKAYCSDAGDARDRRLAAGARRHRLHLGARPAPVAEARAAATPSSSATRAGTASAWRIFRGCRRQAQPQAVGGRR